MTCIVGIIDKETDKVFIGGDSAGTGGGKVTIRKDKKVFIRDNFIIGYTSSFRMGQLLMCDDRFKLREKNKDEDDFHYLVNVFIPSIQELFKIGGYLTKKDEAIEGGTFLLGYNKRLYTIYCDFQIEETNDNYMAVGSGGEFALGSLFSSKGTELTTDQRINKALEAATYFATGVSGPFNILSK